jgi:hypothetical protein
MALPERDTERVFMGPKWLFRYFTRTGRRKARRANEKKNDRMYAASKISKRQ